MRDGLYHVLTPRLCAGFVVENGKVTRCAPILRGKDLPAVHEDEFEWFEERAAIREFDGGMTRAEAERLAAEDIRRFHNVESHREMKSDG